MPQTPNPDRQQTREQGDDPREAPESGEPMVEGRQRGHVVDEKERKIEGATDDKPGKADGKDWESGRHQAV